MKARHVERLLVRYEEGLLSPGDRDAVEAHLASCAACSEELASLRVGMEAVERFEVSRPPADLVPGVLARMERGRRVRRRLVAGAVVAALLLAVVGVTGVPAARAEAVRAVAGVLAYMESVVRGDGGGAVSDEAPAEPDIPVQPAPDAFRRLAYAPGEAIDVPHGMFFLDVETGETEGWTLTTGGTQPGPSYSASADGRYIHAVVDRASPTTTGYVLDRRTGRAHRWEEAALRLVEATGLGPDADSPDAPGLLLFEEAQGVDGGLSVSSGRFILVDQGLQEVSRFELPLPGDAPRRWSLAQGALFSPDGRHLFLQFASQLYRVETATGALVALGQVPESDYQTQPPVLSALRDGSGVLVTMRHAGGSTLRRYSWAGDLRGEVTVPGAPAYLSPDGSLVAWEEALRMVRGQSPGGGENWTAVVVADARTGEPQFRVKGAALTFGDFLEGDRWLADGSGLVVEASDAFHVVAADGSGMRPLAFADVRKPYEAPVPSPDDPDLFAMGRTGACHGHTGRRFQANVSDLGEHMDPWGATSDEVRFSLPHNGHGGFVVTLAVPPLIEFPPLDDALRFVARGDGGCAQLRARPEEAASLVACVPNGTGVALSETENPDPVEASYRSLLVGAVWVYYKDKGYTEWWIHVRAPDGTEGWAPGRLFAWAE